MIELCFSIAKIKGWEKVSEYGWTDRKGNLRQIKESKRTSSLYRPDLFIEQAIDLLDEMREIRHFNIIPSVDGTGSWAIQFENGPYVIHYTLAGVICKAYVRLLG